MTLGSLRSRILAVLAVTRLASPGPAPVIDEPKPQPAIRDAGAHRLDPPDVPDEGAQDARTHVVAELPAVPGAFDPAVFDPRVFDTGMPGRTVTLDDDTDPGSNLGA